MASEEFESPESSVLLPLVAVTIGLALTLATMAAVLDRATRPADLEPSPTIEAIAAAPVFEQPHSVTATDSPTPVPAPVVAGASATPQPTGAPEPPSSPAAPQPTATPEPVSSTSLEPECPPLPIMVSPEPDLEDATRFAVDEWNSYLSCDRFVVTSGGLPVIYHPDWPGECLNPDATACTFNAVLINPTTGPRFHLGGVIAHELGHVINLSHEDAPPIMNPNNWGGAETQWCTLELRCR